MRGPYTFNGYFRAERDNERCFDPHGFYRSGDLVRLREDGYLEVTGRAKDVICRCGETISAQGIEEQLLSHPAIWSAAAVPVPDPTLGEKICAAVVFAGPPVTLAELMPTSTSVVWPPTPGPTCWSRWVTAHDAGRQDRQESNRPSGRRRELSTG